jgi:tRNA-intron endonuclease
MVKREVFGKLQGQTVSVPLELGREIHNKSFYGRVVGERIELSLVEAAYLVHKQKLEVFEGDKTLDFESFFKSASLREEHFELKYIVYRDLRERGYHVKPSVMDFRVYPRGGHPGTTPSRYLVHTLSERRKTPLSELLRYVETADNLKKRLILAIVDEESDITFYELKKSNLKNRTAQLPTESTVATFIEDRVILWGHDFSKKLHQTGFYGKFLDETRLQLSLVEAAYLLKKNIIHLYDASEKPITHSEFMSLANTIEPEFNLKYQTYEDMRERGLIPKTGFKFGAHFRLYTEYTGENNTRHSKYLVHALPHSHEFSLQNFSRAARLAHSVRKHMIYAAVNPERDTITYLEVMRVKL